ncbi:hypothetical protein DITRI_Ditri10aG0130000 [Diplodiscus trichospermus]
MFNIQESFVRVAKEISQKFGVECLPDHAENHLKTVKKKWTTITTIRQKSGFGWDDNLKMITAEKNVYDEEVMALVVGKDIVTGSYAKSFADLDMNTEIDSTPLDDEVDFEEVSKAKDTSASSISSTQKRSHRKRKHNANSNDEGIMTLAAEVKEIVIALRVLFLIFVQK